MLPVIALVGRPNVGKSTMFNRLTRTRDAIVDNRPGVTRDRLYGRGKVGDRPYLVVDTGGIEDDDGAFATAIREQVSLVVEEAEIVFFLLDHSDGLLPQDHEIAAFLRQSGRQVYCLVNKSEGLEPSLAEAEFQALGLSSPIAVSAKRGDGMEKLLLDVLSTFPEDEVNDENSPPVIALVGRPNVGKSTLTNKLLGENRVIVSDIAGTTRDSVRIPMEYNDEPMILVDTAGVRRKSKVEQGVEKFSVVKTLQAIEQANVVALVLDAHTEIGAQDATIAGMITALGRSLVIIINKWDGLAHRQRNIIRKQLEAKLPFLPNADVLFISALHGSRIDEVLPAVMRAYDSAMIDIATSSLNKTLQKAVDNSQPPLHNQRPVRLKFAHQAGKNPPIFVVHGGQAESLKDNYRRYLANFFSATYKIIGTPVRIIPRNTENPFKGNASRLKTYKQRAGRRRKRGKM